MTQGKMPAKQLSQSEIWDDSALVESWNEALDEYKKYHSIAAKRESLEDVLRASGEGDGVTATHTNIAEMNESGGLPAWEPRAVENGNAWQTESGASPPPENVDSSAGQQPTRTFDISSSMAQTLLGTVQDESLKNLMMAWYYAGYYTGLHEGQQTAYAAQNKSGGDMKKV